MQMGVILVGVVIILAALSNPSRFLWICSIIFHSPFLAWSKVLEVAFQTFLKQHKKRVDQGRLFTIWTKLFLKMDYWHESLVEWLVPSVIQFVKGEEMIEVVNVKQKVQYVPVSQRELADGESPATVTMQKLPPKTLARIRDDLIRINSDGTVNQLRQNSTRLETVTLMISGWTGIGQDGAAVKFDPTDKAGMFAILPEGLQEELTNRFGGGSLDWQKVEDDTAEAEAKAAAEAEAA